MTDCSGLAAIKKGLGYIQACAIDLWVNLVSRLRGGPYPTIVPFKRSSVTVFNPDRLHVKRAGLGKQAGRQAGTSTYYVHSSVQA